MKIAAPALRIALAVAMLALTAWLWANLPTKLQSWAPIAVDGVVGERVEGRNLAVTVHEVRLAREITFSNDGVPVVMSTSGAWLVIGLTYESLLSVESPAFKLLADGRTFEAPLDGFPTRVAPGLPDHSVVAFEIPTLPRQAELLAYNKAVDTYGNPQVAPLDSQVSVPLEVPADAEATVDLTEVAEG
ncbi:hypothetical protein [Mycobacterium sp. 236(2023)]|uniref:hypothetical protein n=1 Tax=Mycobacterium sp. 236(2023) TaxID=3038163 RepID=UPI0024151BB7|nr:hypothetical protein [Mycobacterium sp. 236(2023)]MDG4663380.1 hypothetical protein [Mycobacterium sp. 236(2023)]